MSKSFSFMSLETVSVKKNPGFHKKTAVDFYAAIKALYVTTSAGRLVGFKSQPLLFGK